MRQYIRKLQSKSENARRRILIGSLVVSMCFVVTVWISSLGYHFTKNPEKVVKEEISPFNLFKNSVSDTYNNLSASVGDISEKKEVEQEEIKVEKQIDLIPVEYESE